MIATSSPIGHPTMTLKQISPTCSAAFSPNLYRWMKRYGHAYLDGGVAESVFRVRPESKFAKEFLAGTLFIGCPFDQHEGDTDFSGTLLMGVLCRGSKARRYCYAGGMDSLELVEGFWDDYLRVGRCAIDPDHEQDFHGSERYSVAGGVRNCLWCGIAIENERT